MKKVILALGVIATVACFTSCNRTCTCKTYAAGVVIATADDVELESGKKCSDLNTYVESIGGKTGVECY